MSTVWSRNEIESPCIQICLVDPESRLCMGCHRSIDEIKEWSSMGKEARKAIIEELPNRKDAMKPKRRGGRARTRS